MALPTSSAFAAAAAAAAASSRRVRRQLGCNNNLVLCAMNNNEIDDGEQQPQQHPVDFNNLSDLNNNEATTNEHIIDEVTTSNASDDTNDIETTDDDDDDEDVDTTNIQYHLSKISWLPNVKLGKQSYERTTASAMSAIPTPTTTSSILYSKEKRNHRIEILPVLPMTMVCGLGGDILSTMMDTTPSSSSTSKDTIIDDDDDDTTTTTSSSSSSSMIWNNNNNNNDDTTILGFRYDDDNDDDSLPLHHQQQQIILGPPFSNGGTSSYLPHTKNHILTISEPRYKHMYDDLLRLGKYAVARREGMIRREKEEMEEKEKKRRSGISSSSSSGSIIIPSSTSSSSSSFPNPDEKRRFIVTAANPVEDGVFAEYGLLFQLKDLDEVSAVGGVVIGEDGDGGTTGLTMEELEELVGSSYHDDEEDEDDYDDFVDMDDDEDDDDVMEMLLRTHYEATHDVVGRVRIHRFVNPECFTDDPPGGEEYLMAEATILDVMEEKEEGKKKGRESSGVELMREKKLSSAASASAASQGTNGKPSTTTTPATSTLQLEGELAKAVARIKEELRSSVSDAYKEQRQQQVQSDIGMDTPRASLDEAPTLKKPSNDDSTMSSSSSSSPPTTNKRKGNGHINVSVGKQSTLTKEERQLRESFSKLVSLQHELKEECRFTRVSVQTFGIGPVGVWLSAAAWSQFVEKRLEATYDDMQSDLQSKLVEYLAERDGNSPPSGHGKEVEDVASIDGVSSSSSSGIVEEAETIDFEDLSPQLQQEFQFVQARATEELGPLALERAIQMQRIVQAESYIERLDLLRECVDNERRRLEAKKMLKSLALPVDSNRKSGSSSSSFNPGARRERARSLFERLISSTDVDRDQVKDQDNGSFQ